MKKLFKLLILLFVTTSVTGQTFNQIVGVSNYVKDGYSVITFSDVNFQSIDVDAVFVSEYSKLKETVYKALSNRDYDGVTVGTLYKWDKMNMEDSSLPVKIRIFKMGKKHQLQLYVDDPSSIIEAKSVWLTPRRVDKLFTL
tara:strand:- start:70 stop:492 length:423 start_codon:yes stop_codon:yes gene_type:complete